MKKHEYQAVIFEELDKLRTQFNSIVYPEYYRLMPNRELMKSYFLDNCLGEDDHEKHAEELKKAVLVYQMVQFFEGELIRIDPKLIRTSLDLEALNLVINDLISIMVPNAHMVKQLREIFAQAALWLKNKKPILFIELDLIDAFCSLFKQAIRNLQQLMDHQPADLKALYAACQIRNLDYLSINAQKNGRALNQCIDNLRKVFLCEMQYKQHQDQCSQLTFEQFMAKETQAPTTGLFSFGYKKSPGFLSPFIQALVVKVGFLDARTSVEDCVRIITSDNLGLITDKIYLGCKTNEFKYIIKHFKPFFRTLTPTTIEKSGIFISNVGNPITANCLYNTGIENLQTKLTIDNIFNQK